MIVSPNLVNSQRIRYGVYALFFLSGLSALIYQVTWMRYLSLFFGSDVYSSAITLSSFMCGLSIGSYVAHRFAISISRPLLVFSVLELLIGIYAINFPWILSLFHGVFREVYRQSIDNSPVVYNTFRAMVAGAVLVVPTAMMGASLPFISEQFGRGTDQAGNVGGKLYAVNTAGAVFGVLLGGFFLFPSLGFRMTTLVAASFNIIISISAFAISFYSFKQVGIVSYSQDSGAAVSYSTDANSPRDRVAVLLTISLSGFAAMAFEVVVTRWLALSFSATVYSFSIMLACFLIGIAYGSAKASELVNTSQQPAVYLGIIELLLALSLLLIGLCLGLLPSLFGVVLWSMVQLIGGNFSAASVVAMFFSALIVLFIPSCLLGASFPFAVRVWTLAGRGMGHGTGGIYSANTLGALLGALTAAFLMIPFLGLRESVLVIGALFLLSSWLMFTVSGRWNSRFIVFSMAITIFGMVVWLFLHTQPRQIIANYHLQNSEAPKVIYHGEGVAHTIDIVEGSDKNTIMMVDGNIEADTTYLQRRHFVLKGHLPLLLNNNPESALVVGLGLGITLSNTLRHPTVKSVQVVELSPEMVEAQQYLKSINDNVLLNPKLSVRIDDARNFLALEDKKFDMITADPIHPRISGVGYLYTSEYYRSIKNHLNRGGIVCQWMPMYSISANSFNVAFRTFAKEFPNSSFWYVRGHGLFVGQVSKSPVDYSKILLRFNDAVVKRDMDSIGIKSPSQLFGYMLMGPKQIAAYMLSSTSSELNTDDNAWLEHHTPSEFLNQTEEIIKNLMPNVGFDRSYISNASEKDYQDIEAAWNERRSRLLTELKEPIQ